MNKADKIESARLVIGHCQEMLGEAYQKDFETINKALDEYEKNQWISVLERLPEERNEIGKPIPVLVTYLSWDDNTPMVELTAVYDKTAKVWRWYDDREDLENMEAVKVEITAWRPSPVPYKDTREIRGSHPVDYSDPVVRQMIDYMREKGRKAREEGEK